jgi:hypothetical protein
MEEEEMHEEARIRVEMEEEWRRTKAVSTVTHTQSRVGGAGGNGNARREPTRTRSGRMNGKREAMETHEGVPTAAYTIQSLKRNGKHTRSQYSNPYSQPEMEWEMHEGASIVIYSIGMGDTRGQSLLQPRVGR